MSCLELHNDGRNRNEKIVESFVAFLNNPRCSTLSSFVLTIVIIILFGHGHSG